MDNFTNFDSATALALESERINAHLEFENLKEECAPNEDFEISPWFGGVYDQLQKIKPKDSTQNIPKDGGITNSSSQAEVNKTERKIHSRAGSISQVTKRNKKLSPISLDLKKDNSNKLKIHDRIRVYQGLDERKLIKTESNYIDYPSMLISADSISTEHSSSTKKTKFQPQFNRSSHVSLTQKFVELPRVNSYNYLNSYHQGGSREHRLQSQYCKMRGKALWVSDLLKILSKEAEKQIQSSASKTEIVLDQFIKSDKISLTKPSTPKKKRTQEKHYDDSSKAKVLYKQNLVLNLEEPKKSLKPESETWVFPTIRAKLSKMQRLHT